MSVSRCTERVELLSALVDGALPDADRERMLAHLVGCPGCRREVAELRELRRRLGAGPTQVPAPDALSSRLVAIAAAPGRPVGRTRRRVRRAAVGAVALVTAAGAVAGVGYAAAPPPASATLGDPSTPARADFSAVLASWPLGPDAVAAALASTADLQVSAAAHRAPGSAATGQVLDASTAYRLLQRAAGAEDELTYAGVQDVSVGGRDGAVEGRVIVAARTGQPTRLQVVTRAGQVVRTASTPATLAGARASDSELVALLSERYRLSGRTGAQAAGRAATVVSAARLGAGPEAPVAARWWLDDATGLLLGRQVYDADGVARLSAGFRTVAIGPRVAAQPVAPRLAQPTTTASLTVSSADALSAEGWFCSDTLAGLPLVRLRRGGDRESAMVHLVYSDGLQTVSVVEQQGALPVALPGWRRDAELSAYVRRGAPALATWQAGPTVLTVVTTGSPDLLAAAVRALPGEAVPQRTTMGRVHAGWTRILDPFDRRN